MPMQKALLCILLINGVQTFAQQPADGTLPLEKFTGLYSIVVSVKDTIR